MTTNKYNLGNLIRFNVRTNSSIRSYKECVGYIGAIYFVEDKIMYSVYQKPWNNPNKFMEVEQSQIIGIEK